MHQLTNTPINQQPAPSNQQHHAIQLITPPGTRSRSHTHHPGGSSRIFKSCNALLCRKGFIRHGKAR
jgi:hypothetical protein